MEGVKKAGRRQGADKAMDPRVRQNLIDAGCSDEFVRRFDAAPSDAERMRQLRGRRKELLAGIHAEQRRLDCLDYLIYQLKREGA